MSQAKKPNGLAICSSVLSTAGFCHPKHIKLPARFTVKIQQIVKGTGYVFEAYLNGHLIVNSAVKNPKAVENVTFFAASDSDAIADAQIQNILFTNWRWGEFEKLLI